MNPLLQIVTSIKFAITLIALIILVAIVGTFLPNGTFIYSSPIFFSLIGLLAVSIISCTSIRLVPTWQIVRGRVVEVSDAFVMQLPHNSTLKAIDLEEVKKQLRGYKFIELNKVDSSYLFAQKGQISRFGAHFTHIGVLILLLGATVGGVYGYSKIVVLPMQQLVTVSGAEIKLNSFEVNYYDNGMPREYKAHVTITEGDALHNYSLAVNRPLTYKGTSFFLDSFDADGFYHDGKPSWVALKVRSDPGEPIVWTGAAATLTGLIMSFYIPHKRIWIKKSGGSILLGGKTNKNKSNFSREFEQLVTNLGGVLPVKDARSES
jgi:cytochrome c biogenesis protein ResB